MVGRLVPQNAMRRDGGDDGMSDCPPPSTTAAQLVRNHAGPTHGSRRDEEGVTFHQLLQDILDESTTPEKDPEVNKRLIETVIKAGLDVLSESNPFTQWDSLLAQAIDSLAVLELTVRRQPEILFLGDAEATDTHRRPVPILLVLSTVFSLSCHPKKKLLKPRLQSLMQCLVMSLSKSLTIWHRSHAVLDVFRDCVMDLISMIQRPQSYSKPTNTGIQLPPARSLTHLLPEAQQAVALPAGCQMHVRTPASGIELALLIMSSVLDLSNADVPLRLLQTSSNLGPVWLLDDVLSIVQALLVHRPYFEQLQSFADLVLESLRLYHHLVLSSRLVQARQETLSPYTVASICRCCSDLILAMINRPLPAEVQEELGKVMQGVLGLQSCQGILEELLLPSLQTLASDNVQLQACQDTLRHSVNACLAGLQPNGFHEFKAVRDVHDDTAMVDVASEGLAPVPESEIATVRKKRRLRTSTFFDLSVHFEKDELYTHLVSRVVTLLGQKSGAGLSGLSHATNASYATLSDPDRDQLWRLLGACACAASGCIQKTGCVRCNGDRRLRHSEEACTWPDGYRDEDKSEILAIIEQLCVSPELQCSDRHRVLATLAIRSFVLHIRDEVVLDLSDSRLAEWCMKSLQSTSRELRVAAGRALAAFLRQKLPSDLRNKNRRCALDFLRILSSRGMNGHHETLILAWGQIAVVCGDEELNLSLLRLVDYLGHPNSLICALAYSELESIQQCLLISPQALLKPFYRSIAVSVVQDIHTKPQKIQRLVDFLAIDVDHFLVLSQRETLPFLVLAQRKDVLQRIASARGGDTTIQDLCLSPPQNLAAILAFLLSQPSKDVEASTMRCLLEVAPGLVGDNLASLIKLDPVLVACELLKSAGDDEERNLSKAYHVIQSFAVMHERRSDLSRTSGKAGRMLANFFEAHVLGIMTAFSDTIENMFSVHTSEKARCIKAIEHMIKLARSNIVVALPQIRACLQSAIEQDGLQDTAFSAWLTLISTLDGADVVDLVDHTFALVVQHWSEFSSELQQKTYDSIGDILKTHSSLIREKVITVPSLETIPLMSKFEAEIQRLKEHERPETHLKAFTERLRDENASIVWQALKELKDWLEIHQSLVHEIAISEQSKDVISDLLRALLDVCARPASNEHDIANLGTRCIGIIGCLDPNRVEVSSSKRRLLLLSNFDKASEVIDWVALLLEDIIVPAFKSSTNARAQGFLAYVMQELVRFCEFNEVASAKLRASQVNPAYSRWFDMPESVRNTLTPFLTSRYFLSAKTATKPEPCTYPIYSTGTTASSWLREWVYDMLWRGKGVNAEMVFPYLARISRGHDLSLPAFLLPYVALNIVLGGTIREADEISAELLVVLSTESSVDSERETLKQCSEHVFAVLDYMSSWLQEKKHTMAISRTAAIRAGHSPSELDESSGLGQIACIERVISSIPADVIAQRSLECGSYARALFHWERHVQEQKRQADKDAKVHDALYQRLHSIYSHIDEPDGLDGIAAHLNILTPEQQAFQHRRAGRWPAAQSWYEIELEQKPSDPDLQVQLLGCLKESGQFEQILRYAEANSGQHGLFNATNRTTILPFVTEACWTTGKMDHLDDLLTNCPEESFNDFNTGVARVLVAMKQKDKRMAGTTINKLRDTVTKSLTSAAASSLKACHDVMLKLHVLYEMDILSSVSQETGKRKTVSDVLGLMDKRLAVIGSYIPDKQYLLGIRRAIMGYSDIDFRPFEIGSAWLTTARLARKANISKSAHYAVFKAFQCGDDAAKLEQARLLWRDDQHRQAIQSLEGAIVSDAFAHHNRRMEDPSNPEESQRKQNRLSARAHLLLAKWLDASGQTQAAKVTVRYQYAAKYESRWEKGHYYLGKHYNKLLEAEKSLPPGKQSDAFLHGEMTKLVIENYLRSVPFGSKYWYETIPKIITLWLDLGMDCLGAARGEAQTDVLDRRARWLDAVHRQMKKYFDRIPPYIFYNSLPQLISRISHPNPKVYEILAMFISKIVSTHPSQALWSLLAVAKSSATERASRGAAIVNKLKDPKRGAKSDTAGIDLRTMITQGQRLSDGLLQACDLHIESRSAHVSLSKDLSFNHKLAPSSLVIPIESTLIANRPLVQDAAYIRKFVAFAQDKVTIASFSDDVLVLSSLQRPRKLTVRGSDGNLYGLLCKPKDDLRKDQRLMEFNTMINRALKRDEETSKRQLYIKTYGVTPLSEESGIIEWVEGIKPLRDILLKAYQRKGIHPNYNELRKLLAEASADPENVGIFTDKVLPIFPPILHEWFAEVFPEPDVWFAARIRYARSAAVMSIVGHVLGLGDRHGENILLQEGTGGVFHVDFNCLFDKGLTFEKPELVPFRLTHNMVDAMGAYGYDGPFRKTAELTTKILRQYQDTLLNILETFVYDPTTDFVGKKKRTTPGVPETPQEVLDSVSSKLRGLLKGESVPLSVEGHVNTLIAQAVDPWNLCQMYIGWCAFL